MHSFNGSLAYLFIAKYDRIPRLTNSRNNIDYWKLFCPLNGNDRKIYSYFLDNEQTKDHQAILIGLRELALEKND